MARERLRVLFLIDYLWDIGGAERFVAGLATHLPRDRFEPWVCFTRGASAAPMQALDEAQIPHFSLGRRGKLDVYCFAKLWRVLRRERFDVLHAHLFGSNLWGTLLGRAAGVPVVIAHEHTWSYEGSRLREWLDGRVIGRLATRFLAVSHADARRMIEIERVPAEKVVVMPTAYIPRPAAAAADIRRELGLGPDAPLALTATVLRPQKAIEVMLEAHSLVLQRVADAQLLIAGDGPSRDALTRHAEGLVLDGSVHFLGARRDVDALLSAANVAVLSSDFEGTPLFVFECMAAGTPLVATAVGGVPDVIEDGRSGLLVPPRDPSALADAITNLLANPSRRASLSAVAAEQLPRFTIENVTARFAALYEQLSEEHSQ